MLHLVTEHANDSVSVSDLQPYFRNEGTNSQLTITEDKQGFEVEVKFDVVHSYIWRYISMLQRPDGTILLTQWASYQPENYAAEMYPDYKSFVRRSSWSDFIAAMFTRVGLNATIPTAHQVHDYLHGERQRKATPETARLVADLESGDWHVRREAAEKLFAAHHAELADIRSWHLSVEQREAIERLSEPVVLTGSSDLMMLLWDDTEKD